MKFNDPICLKETLVRIYSTKKQKTETMYEMQLLTLTSHATYAMHRRSILRFAASVNPWSSNRQLCYKFTLRFTSDWFPITFTDHSMITNYFHWHGILFHITNRIIHNNPNAEQNAHVTELLLLLASMHYCYCTWWKQATFLCSQWWQRQQQQ